LESKLAKLGRFQGGKSGSKIARGFGANTAIPKSRGNWAGRGLKPRRLTAAIKSGNKPENFLIAGAVATKANGGKKSRKAKKSAKEADRVFSPDDATTVWHRILQKTQRGRFEEAGRKRLSGRGSGEN